MNKIIISRDQAVAIVTPERMRELNSPVLILGIRGYGDIVGGNKRGIYDDALVLITPDLLLAVNANTDPSITRKGIAVLQDGDYWYKKGLHGIHHLDQTKLDDQKILHTLLTTGKDIAPIPGRILPYYAFRQDSPVTVLRDEATAPECMKDPANWPWIDIHRGGYNTTSSEGCQTIFPDFWPDFRDAGFAAMEKYNCPRIPYCLRTKTA